MINSVVIISSHYHPHIGGVEIYTQNLALQLARRNYEVSIVTTNTHSLPFLSKNGDLTVYRLSAFFLFGQMFPIPYSFPEFIKIYRNCFNKKNTLCIIQTRLFVTSFLAALLSFISGVRAICVEHGAGYIYYKNNLLSSLFHIYEHINTFFIKLANPVWFGATPQSSDWLTHFGIAASGVISNGINPEEKIVVPPEVARFPKQNKKIITFVSRLLREKGIFELIDGFISFSQEYDNYILVIIGGGEIRGEVEKKIKNHNNILYLGEMEHDKTLGVISISEYFVNPSMRTEALTTTVLEAASLGVPVISTAIGGLAQVMKHLNTGYIIGKVTAAEIEAALKYMTTHQTEAETMADNMHRLVREGGYSWDKITDAFLNRINWTL